jgi:hypothetical protein
MIVEVAVERYSFECGNCGHTWTADYDVLYLEDHEDVWSFYRLDGFPVPSPAADDILCPVCRHGQVVVRLIARRDVPLVSPDGDEPRQQVTSTAEERRADAPPLPATSQPPAHS